MIARLTDTNKIFDFIQNNAFVVLVFADECFFNILTSELKNSYSTVSVLFIPMSEDIAIDMQVIRYPQFRIYQDGHEVYQVVGKQYFSKVIKDYEQKCRDTTSSRS